MQGPTQNCYSCDFWRNRNSGKKGCRIPDGKGKCTRPDGQCDPEIVKGEIGKDPIYRKKLKSAGSGEPCAECGKVGHHRHVDDDGEPLCFTCWKARESALGGFDSDDIDE